MLENKKKILDSWKRCLQYGIKKGIDGPKLYEKEGVLVKKLEINNDLINIFIKKVSNLTNKYKHILKNYAFFLIDKEGMLLSLYGNKYIKEELNKKRIKVGVYLTEESCGTNAVSLAMDTKKIVKISNDEHYCNFFYNWDCIAAPLKLKELIIGYIDMSLINNCFKENDIFIINYLVMDIILEYIKKNILVSKKTIIKEDLRKILVLTTQGFSIKEISKIMNISESSVKYKRAKLCEIYNAKNFYEVIALYFANNIIDLMKLKINKSL